VWISANGLFYGHNICFETLQVYFMFEIDYFTIIFHLKCVSIHALVWKLNLRGQKRFFYKEFGELGERESPFSPIVCC
jgi:hypothetical protein